MNGGVIRVLSIVFIFGFLIATSTAFAEPKSYVLGVVPQYAVTSLHKEWRPIVDHLEKSLGIKLTLKLYNNFEDFEADLYSGNLDFSYMNPNHMIHAHKLGFEPLVASSTEKLLGIIVVPINSSINNIADLKNKTIAFPAPSAFGASILIRAYLSQVAKMPFKAVYFGNHDNAYRAALYGKASAAGGVNKSFIKQPLDVQQNLRIIFKTPETSSHPFAASKKISKDIKIKMTKELISYSQTEEGVKLLANVGLDRPVMMNYEKDYKNLEELHLKSF